MDTLNVLFAVPVIVLVGWLVLKSRLTTKRSSEMFIFGALGVCLAGILAALWMIYGPGAPYRPGQDPDATDFTPLWGVLLMLSSGATAFFTLLFWILFSPFPLPGPPRRR